MLHLAYLALNEFYCKNERLPEVNDFTDSDKMLEISKIMYSLSKDKKRDWAIGLNENLNELYIIYLSIWSRLNPAPICSYLGGIVAQEIIKITGKFTPFNQWYYCDFFYLLKNEHKKNVKKPLKEDHENRYFDQICIFGKEIQENFKNLNLFIIGCGALGTEFLKIFSFRLYFADYNFIFLFLLRK
jgi:ubiquitin-activating enzyme E1